MSLLHRHAVRRHAPSGPPPGANLVFHAITPDGSEIMQGVLIGTGSLAEARVSSILLPDHQVEYQEFGAEPGYEGGRVTGAVGNRVVYANDGASPLPEIPKVVHAPQSTNYATDTNALDVWSDWYLISSDAIPLAGLPGVRAIPSTNVTSTHMIFRTGMVCPDQATIVSIFAKAAGYDGLGLLPHSSNTAFQCGFDLTNGTVVGFGSEVQAAEIVHIGGGVYRCVMRIDRHSRDLRVNVGPASLLNPNGRFSNFSGDLSSGVDIAAPQIEQGDVMTPPILTGGAAVTRDACTLIFDAANHDDIIGAYYFEATLEGDSEILDGFLSLVDPNAILTDGVNSAIQATAPGQRKFGAIYGDGNMELCVDGVWSTQVAYDGTLLNGALDLFRTATINGAMRNLQRWDGTYAALKDKIDELMA